jgi:hypothetical protein
MSESRAPAGDPGRLDLQAICDALRGGVASPAWLDQWLPATWAAPERFHAALHTHASSRKAGLRSRPAKEYDLYNDCVIANLDRRRPAFVGRDAKGEVELSFTSLHQRCSALMAAWRSAGVEASQSVCIVLPIGLDFMVALMTALRMGLIVSTVPPVAPTYVRGRLEALAPDRVVTAPRHLGMLGRFEEGALPAVPVRAGGEPASHKYEPDEPALRVLSPFGGPGAAPVELPASRLHENLLRDALLVFCLDERDTLCAPDLDAAQFQPTLMLTALIAGATYAEVAVEEVDADLKTLGGLSVTVLGVGRRLREALLRPGAERLGSSVRAWFRSLTGVLDLERWDELGRSLAARKIAGFNVVVNTASGGAQLFSPRALSAPLLEAWPVPGQPWQISEVAAGALSALNDAGVYTPLSGGEPDLSLARLLVSRRGGAGLLCAGTLDPGRDAQAYPAGEVAGVVERHPAVRNASVVVAPGRFLNDARVVLLVFVDDTRGPDGRFMSPVAIPEIKELVSREMGERLLPDRIEVYPLRPRLASGAVDHAWCRSQYLSGALKGKSRSELFVLLSRLGRILDTMAPEK